jgi:hypothetical protein
VVVIPLISQFYGILIRMFYNDCGQHNSPHFHAIYGDYTASYSFEGSLLAGNIPPKQNKLIVAWAALHEDELNALWKVMQESGEYFTIKGLE